jgi:hypothetical protein
MARSKAQLTHAKRDRERARLEKRARKQEKRDARKQAKTGDDGVAPEEHDPTPEHDPV